MTEHVRGDVPLNYDEERLQQFYRRATGSRNMSARYRPEGEVDVSAVADALIGIYIDKSEATLLHECEKIPTKNDNKIHETHLRNLSRAAFAIDFLQGVPLEELRDRSGNDPTIRREGVLNYALRVASDGAREVRHIVDGDSLYDGKIRAEVKSHKEKAETPVLEVVKAHEDLDDIIKRLHEKGRMKNIQAQSLLLLFELQVSSASPEAKRSALHSSRVELHRKIKAAMMDQAIYERNEFKNPRIGTGVQYLSLVVGNPLSGKNDYMKLSGVVDRVQMHHEALVDREHARLHVHSHVAYALEALYP